MLLLLASGRGCMPAAVMSGRLNGRDYVANSRAY